MRPQAVVMLDPWGDYDGLWIWLNGLLDSGYISQVAMDRLVLVDKVGAAIEACAPA
jgi:predicted Rossmann-fold nucleotide-binding protein